MLLYIFICFSVAVVALVAGISLGGRMRGNIYNGYLIAKETPEGLILSLELLDDPELLVFQDSVNFKVVPPNYEALLREGN